MTRTGKPVGAGLLCAAGGLAGRWPWLVIALVALVTAALAPFVFRLKVEADVTKMLPEDDPGRATTAVVNREFGGADMVAVVVEARDVFAPGVLGMLDALSAELERVPGVTGVQSLVTLEDVRGQGEDVVISRLVDSIPKDSARLAALRGSVLGDRRYRGVLVAEDGTATLVLVRTSPYVNQEAVVSKVERVVGHALSGYASSDDAVRFSLAGSPALMKYMRDWMTRDLVRLLPLVVLILALVLFVSFRRWYGVVLPLLAVGIALVWTMGIVGLSGQPLTIVLVVLPPVLVSVGSAYGIHVVKRWERERGAGRDARDAARVAIAQTGLPVFLAMATTVAGFGSNAFLRIAAIRSFAVFSCIGVVLSFLLGILFVPSVLALVRDRDRGQGENEAQSHKSEAWGRNAESYPAGLFGRWGEVVCRRRWLVLCLAAVICLAAVFFARRVHPETDFVQYFKPGSSPTRAARIVDERFGGGQQFEFTIDADITDPEVLSRMEKFQEGLEAIPHVTRTFSIVNVLRSTNRAFSGGREAEERLPQDRAAVAQYLLLLSFSGSDFLADYITQDNRLARITAAFDRAESREISRAMKEIRRLMVECFDRASSDVVVSVGGLPMAILAMHEGIARSQLGSVIAALAAVMLMTALAFRSFRLGLAAMVPMAFTLCASFGVMGMLGLQVDVVTAMLGSIAVGIGVDYSCHLIARYREEKKAFLSQETEESDVRSQVSEISSEGSRADRIRNSDTGEEKSSPAAVIMRRTVAAVGPAIATNALSVGLGFAALALSSLVIIQKFGLLIAGTMAYSGLGALAILVALLGTGGRQGARSRALPQRLESQEKRTGVELNTKARDARDICRLGKQESVEDIRRKR